VIDLSGKMIKVIWKAKVRLYHLQNVSYMYKDKFGFVSYGENGQNLFKTVKLYNK